MQNGRCLRPGIKKTFGTNKATCRNILVALLLAVGFVLVFGTVNTPLGPQIGSDNAMYLTMGTALAKGYTPYRDIFDHKGPLLFAIQMIPQMLTADGYSTLAVHIQEILFLFASLCVLGKIAMRAGVRSIWVVQLVFLACLSPYLDGGNLTEEYAALFILLGVEIAERVFDTSRDSDVPMFIPAGILGACAMLAFLLRANNALGLCGMAAGIALGLLIERTPWKKLGACASGFVLGCAVAFVPCLLWLGKEGVLEDAFYGAILHNMMYAKTSGMSRLAVLFTTAYGRGGLLMATLTCAGALGAWLRTKRYVLPLGMVGAAALSGMSCFISHKYYQHYLMVMVPFATWGAVQVLAWMNYVERKRIYRIGATVTVACAVVMLGVCGYRADSGRRQELARTASFDADAQALYAQVPENERDRFMAYRVEPRWYVAAKALPCVRFYFLQEILADADPAVMDEIVQTFETEPPVWLVLYYNREFGPPYDTRMAEIFSNRYTFVDAQGEYQLLHLKEEYAKREP